MPWYRVGGNIVHFKMAKGHAPLHCREQLLPGEPCMAMSSCLCDWPVGDEGHTCSKPICDEHAHVVGKNRHYCPRHYDLDRNVAEEQANIEMLGNELSLFGLENVGNK